MKIRIYYNVPDGEDGSAHPDIHKSQADLDAALEELDESGGRDMSEGGSYFDIETDDFEIVK